MPASQHESNCNLFKAIVDGDSMAVEHWIEEGANLSFIDGSGLTALHTSVFSSFQCDIEIVKILIKNHADVNAKCQRGYTPLHYAAFSGDLDCVKALIENGADISAISNKYQTPLEYAKTRKNAAEESLINLNYDPLIKMLSETIEFLQDYQKIHDENKNLNQLIKFDFDVNRVEF